MTYINYDNRIPNFKWQNENCECVFSPKSIVVSLKVRHGVCVGTYSEKSKPLIIYEGYKFRFHKTLQNDEQRWPCCVKNCNFFIKLSSSNIIVESNTNHEHSEPDIKTLNRQIMSNYLKRKALVDISYKPSKLIRSEVGIETR